MKYYSKISFLLLLILALGCQKKLLKETNSTVLFPKGNKVESKNFIGNVYVQMFTQEDTTHNVTMGNVSFEPGARTNWHFHPGGQILVVTDGIGYYQEKGNSIQWMKKGDVIKCPKNIEHWHGAAPTTGVTHLAISTNTNLGGAVWTRPVTEEEYKKGPSK